MSQNLRSGETKTVSNHLTTDMHIGEPDSDTPENIIEVATPAMRAGETHYTALDGTPEVKDSVREKFSGENSLEFFPEEIVVNTGAKMALFSAFFATLKRAGEVILPAPYWVSCSDISEMRGPRPWSTPRRTAEVVRCRGRM